MPLPAAEAADDNEAKVRAGCLLPMWREGGEITNLVMALLGSSLQLTSIISVPR